MPTSCTKLRKSLNGVISVTFEKFELEELTILRKRNEGKLAFRIVRGFVLVMINSPPRKLRYMCFPHTFPIH